ncbi:MAG: sugar ABC transporter ATP-binding protein [Acidobacteriota bacterium]|nr:sugar ABC transporter ATP-binding protein [Acidobacteriota bacterium]
MATTEPAIRFERVTRRFPGVLALDSVSFDVAAGSCHALCGENGAGKSTLGRILGGICPPDAGRVLISGRPVSFAGPEQALAAGVAIVHQELSFCENLSVAENLCLGSLPRAGPFLRRDVMEGRAENMLAAIGAAIDVNRLVGELSTGQQQMLQIAGAVGRGARVIVFDEPTSSLSQHEAERLYALLRTLRDQGVTLIYVSHRLDEIFRLCDTITVLRDGRHVVTQPAGALNEATLVEAMIGRSLGEYFPKHLQSATGRELLRVDALSSGTRFHDVSFTISAGEVVGLAGLVGAGRSEVALALFGLDPEATGQVWIDDVAGIPRSPAHALHAGVALVPEDRKRQGLILSMSAVANTTLPTLKALSTLTFVRRRAERAFARSFLDRLRVRVSALDSVAAGLSGGTQQKVVLAKWLAAKCRVLILDEPTRGVDVGAKAEIHALVDELASAGHAVLLISSELPEILHLSTRIIVLRGGRVAGELPRAQATQADLMRLMGGTNQG